MDALNESQAPLEEAGLGPRRAFRTIVKGASFRAVSQGVGLFLGLLGSVFVVRALGVAGFGTLQFALSLATFFALVADIGVGVGVTRMSSHEASSDVLWGRAGLRIALVSGLVGTLSVAGLALTIAPPVPAVLIVLAPVVVGTAVSSAIRGFLTARRQIVLVEGTTLLQRALHHGGAIALAVAGAATIFRVAGTIVLSHLLIVMVLLFAWRRAAGATGERGGLPVRRLLGFSFPLLLQRISLQAMHRLDVIMLGFFAGTVAVGLYTPALRLADLILVAFSLMGSYYLPVATRLLATDDLHGLRKLYVRLTKWQIALVSPVLAVLIVAPVPVLVFLFGPAFERAGGIVRILTIGYAAHVICGQNGGTLVALGKSRVVGIRASLALVANVALNVGLIPQFGAIGAAFATAATVLGVNAANSFLIYRLARIHVFTREIGIVLSSAALAAALTGLLVNRLGLSASLLAPFLVGGVVGLISITAAGVTGTKGKQLLGRFRVRMVRSAWR